MKKQCKDHKKVFKEYDKAALARLKNPAQDPKVKPVSLWTPHGKSK